MWKAWVCLVLLTYACTSRLCSSFTLAGRSSVTPVVRRHLDPTLINFGFSFKCRNQHRIPRAESTSRSGLLAHRAPFVGGNWKCNGSRESVKQLVNSLNGLENLGDDVQVVVAPPSLFTGEVLATLRPDMRVATQNVGLNKGAGAYTGELSGEMIKAFGVDWCIIGHSERREGFGMAGEPNDLVALKTRAALDQGLSTIVCIGEHLKHRESGLTMDVLNEQLEAICQHVEPKDWENIVLAYEPVWAIGTGVTATPQQAQETHRDIRRAIQRLVGPEVAGKARIIYGGSVKSSNADDLYSQDDVDGFLVGGASLTPEFLAVIRSTSKEKTKA